MSQTVWHRKFAAGFGTEKALAATRNPGPPAPITWSPEEEGSGEAGVGDLGFVLGSFTADDAWELGHLLHARLRPLAPARPALISISLASGGGAALFEAATGPGLTPDNAAWVARKRASALRFGTSSWRLGRRFAGDEAAFAAKYGLGPESAGRFAIHGGAVPIRVVGVEGVVAVVVVSGLKQHEDHGVIVEVIRDHWVPIEG
ncbi:hypothetical protein HRG_010237 [Hirsutella rhossiliensis]|uniref:DUF967 domain protein n=1 Tax=Hirsutella rhossiliensis TaxID=111463 RepID=A0A9P8SEN7_9HYPO|nr:uncharacterized protein HRG_10237 [Hirsutella rhossiliensis]KAH0958550.1 hypothetical protein HRG_10237 [Hirsutella rhossiliensis]